MSLTNFGLPPFLAGLAALAALLFALQRLRVRHRDVVVVTTLFWPREVEETRARVLVERFRRPWVYALLLAIAALLWLAVAAPRVTGGDSRERVILIDGSASAAVGSRLAGAIELAAQRAAECPPATTRVMIAGSRLSCVLERGESPDLLARRCEGRVAEACPSTLEAALLALAAERTAAGLVVEIVGDAPVARAAIEALPAQVEVGFLAADWTGRGDGVGIVALGVTEAASGAYAAVDLFVATGRTRGSAWREPRAVRTTRDGAEEPLELESLPEVNDAEVRRYVARDVSADGRTLTVRLDGTDALALDDVARCVLPDRPRLVVAVESTAPAALHAALAADPAVEVVSTPERAALVVRRASSAFGARLPSLVLTERNAAAAAFRVQLDYGAEDEPATTLDSLVDALALREIDAASLATTAGQELRAEVVVGEPLAPRAIEVWEALFSAEFDFAQSAAFPRFVAQSLRFLAAVAPLAPECAAGRPLREPGVVAPLLHGDRGLETLGDVVIPPRAGEYRRFDSRTSIASLLDPSVTRGEVDVEAELPRVERASGAPLDLTRIALCVAFGLLVLEWALVRRERIP